MGKNRKKRAREALAQQNKPEGAFVEESSTIKAHTDGDVDGLNEDGDEETSIIRIGAGASTWNEEDEAASEDLSAMNGQSESEVAGESELAGEAESESEAEVEGDDEDESSVNEAELLVSEEAAAEEVDEEVIAEALQDEVSAAHAPGDESVSLANDADPVAVAHQSEDNPPAAEAAPDLNKITDRAQITQVLEAIIFAAPKSISQLRLRNLLNSFQYDTSNLAEILNEIVDASADRGFQLIKVAGGFQYRTHPEHAAVLQKLLEDKPARLSGSALEVLSIIAYKQPLSRSEIDSVRGVDSGHLLKGLLEKNLVRTVGHSENAGRALLYGTTPYFLEIFGLGSLDDLPATEEFQRELKPHSADGHDTLILAEDPGFTPDSSELAANPDRGRFDEINEEAVEDADFGLAERAREESELGPEASA